MEEINFFVRNEVVANKLDEVRYNMKFQLREIEVAIGKIMEEADKFSFEGGGENSYHKRFRSSNGSLQMANKS